MLPPIRIVKPHSVGSFIVLLLHRRKEFVHLGSLRVVAKVIADPSQNQNHKNCDDDISRPAAGGLFVVLPGIQQGHASLSITETNGEKHEPPGSRRSHRLLLAHSALFARKT